MQTNQLVTQIYRCVIRTPTGQQRKSAYVEKERQVDGSSNQSLK